MRSMSTLIAPESASLTDLIEARQHALRLSDQELCNAVGFERSITLTLIKAGTMKFPINKVPALAAVLDLDPADLLKTALTDASPDLLQTIEAVFNPLHLSASEVKLIEHLRELSGDRKGDPVLIPGHGVIALIAA